MAERKTRGKKTEAKPEVVEVNENQVAIAEELNALLGCDPAIPVTGNADAYEKSLAEAAKLIIADDEKDIKPETWSALNDLGLLDHIAEAEAESKKEEAAPEKKKRTPPTPPKRYSRFDAVVDQLKKDGSLKVDNVIADADKEYVKQGGKTSVDSIKEELNWATKLLTALGYATVEKGEIKLS